MTSRDQLSVMVMGWLGLAGSLLSFSEGRSSVGPKTVARLCRDILFTVSFSATLCKARAEGVISTLHSGWDVKIPPPESEEPGIERTQGQCTARTALGHDLCNRHVQVRHWLWLSVTVPRRGTALALASSMGTNCRFEQERRPLAPGFLGSGAAWENRRYLFKWSRRKRKVSRLASGRDSSRLSMQLSFATGSERATEGGRSVPRGRAQPRDLS